ncbi:hypothetical protein G0U57_018711 [Chelydra serpentina]|uniref:Uncharacterized protein n=1 Tax=Chelydra serpentina TaxID=8475 RepID=A0A8T1TGH6_CHESE|nr:hypothetical protein G0U57_018711 [Chelydra serpentina]
MHPRSKQWHLIDCIIVPQCDIRDVRITRVMHGVECWMDQRMLRSILNLHIVATGLKCPKTIKTSPDIVKLNHASYQDNLGDNPFSWVQFRETVQKTATDVLEWKKRAHCDWFD